MVVNNLAIALTKLGHVVIHVTPFPKNQLKPNDRYCYKVERFGFRGDGKLKLLFPTAVLSLAYAVKKHKIDIVNVHNVHRAGAWAFFYKNIINKNLPVIATPHGDDVLISSDCLNGVRLNPRSDKIVRRNLSLFEKVIAISPSIYCVLRSMNISDDKIINIPNGIWLENFIENGNVNELKKKYGLPKDNIIIISIGRNHPVKGFDYGIDAIEILVKEGLPITYILVGRDMAPLIEKVKAIGIQKNVIFTGEVEQRTISELLNISDVYFSPSNGESFGLTTLEAMAAGLPCVVTNVSGNRDIVEAANGIFVKSKDSKSMSDAIKCLALNSQLKKEMGNASKRISYRFGWISVAERYAETFKEILKSKN